MEKTVTFPCDIGQKVCIVGNGGEGTVTGLLYDCVGALWFHVQYADLNKRLYTTWFVLADLIIL